MNAVTQGRCKMREIKTERLKLLAKVRENREKHIAAYKEAMDGYKDEALKAVDKGMATLRKQVEDLKSGECMALAHVYFHLPVPENHSKDYDQVIAMLDMSVDEHITVKSDEFAMYVMDDWSWKQAFETTAAGYLKKG
jgi:hypothetical protein